jgi:hypothetical protein
MFSPARKESETKLYAPDAGNGLRNEAQLCQSLRIYCFLCPYDGRLLRSVDANGFVLLLAMLHGASTLPGKPRCKPDHALRFRCRRAHARAAQ